MSFRSHSSLGTVAMLALFVACADRPHQPTGPESYRPPQPTGLVVSVSAMVPGRVATVRGVFNRTSEIPAVGSFTLRVAYDTTQLTFDSDATTGTGMRVMNARDGVLTIAGASAQGFGDTLFAARFRVTGAEASQSLLVDIAEIHSVGFADLVPALNARGSIRATRTFGSDQ